MKRQEDFVAWIDPGVRSVIERNAKRPGVFRGPRK